MEITSAAGTDGAPSGCRTSTPVGVTAVTVAPPSSVMPAASASATIRQRPGRPSSVPNTAVGSISVTAAPRARSARASVMPGLPPPMIATVVGRRRVAGEDVAQLGRGAARGSHR